MLTFQNFLLYKIKDINDYNRVLNKVKNRNVITIKKPEKVFVKIYFFDGFLLLINF